MSNLISSKTTFSEWKQIYLLLRSCQSNGHSIEAHVLENGIFSTKKW